MNGIQPGEDRDVSCAKSSGSSDEMPDVANYWNHHACFCKPPQQAADPTAQQRDKSKSYLAITILKPLWAACARAEIPRLCRFTSARVSPAYPRDDVPTGLGRLRRHRRGSERRRSAADPSLAKSVEQLNLSANAQCVARGVTLIKPPQFIVVPWTGLQNCRRIPLPHFICSSPPPRAASQAQSHVYSSYSANAPIRTRWRRPLANSGRPARKSGFPTKPSSPIRRD